MQQLRNSFSVILFSYDHHAEDSVTSSCNVGADMAQMTSFVSNPIYTYIGFQHVVQMI